MQTQRLVLPGLVYYRVVTPRPPPLLHNLTPPSPSPLLRASCAKVAGGTVLVSSLCLGNGRICVWSARLRKHRVSLQQYGACDREPQHGQEHHICLSRHWGGARGWGRLDERVDAKRAFIPEATASTHSGYSTLPLSSAAPLHECWCFIQCGMQPSRLKPSRLQPSSAMYSNIKRGSTPSAKQQSSTCLPSSESYSCFFGRYIRESSGNSFSLLFCLGIQTSTLQ